MTESSRGRCLQWVLATCAVGCWSGLAAEMADPGEWPRYGHDAALTARSACVGKISKPQTLWSYSTAGREWLLEITATTGEHRLRLDANETKQVDAPTRHKQQVKLEDLDGTGTLRPIRESYHERWAKILPEVKGWQKVAWNQTWTDQKVCRLQLFAYDKGFSQPRIVWQTDPPEDTIFQPLDIVYDLDGDGVQEICVAAHYRVMIFEGSTGRKESELRYHHSRPYGWFGLADVDGDGRMELITIGDFQSHIDVLNYDSTKPEAQRLSVRWRREIEQNIEERKKWPQVGPHPLVDVTGGAGLEMVLNLFNDTGDGQWHAVVLNAATGESLYDFPRSFLQGSADADGDGKSDLFLAETDGVFVPAFGRIRLTSLAGKKPAVLWSETNACWGVADLPAMGSTWSTSASQGMRDILASEITNRASAFLVAQREGNEAPFSTKLSAIRFSAGHAEKIWQVSGLVGDLQFVALNEEKPGSVDAVVRLNVPRNTVLSVACTNSEARLTGSHSLGVTVSTPIAARLRPNYPMTLIVEGAAQEIFALQAPKGSHAQPRLLWSRPGRGMSDGSRTLGPLAADLEGNGGKQVVVAGQDGAGRAMLMAYRNDGSKLWQHCFEQVPGAVPVWNVGALTFWWPGQFRQHDKTDLFVNTRRGLMHSDIGQLLDGRSGAVVWQQEKAVLPGQFSWGYAGTPPAVADVDGDGLDEIISLYPVCYWFADGRTGKLKNGVELASRKKVPAWAAYGEPMIHRFTARANPEVLLDSPYILGLLDTNGTPLWHGTGRVDFPTGTNDPTAGQTTSIRHALVDFDGDGRFEVASAGYGDGLRCIDPHDGKVLWSLPVPSPTCHRVVAANIDGRKGDEILYSAGAKLIAVTGNRTSGRILWEWEGQGTLGMPAIADVDGDGLAEIVVQGADGTVYVIGNSE